jgi:hypothetical protein
MRHVASIEMLVSYFGLAGLLAAAVSWRRRPEFWVIAAFCTAILLSQSLVVVNLGTLYRFRYGYHTLLVGLGLLYWFNTRAGRGLSQPAAGPEQSV